jgi:hypothetical protein
VSAILSDYDLTYDGNVSEATLTLQALKTSAAEEDATGFDASGSGGTVLEDPKNHEGDHGSNSKPSDSAGLRSTSDAISSLSVSSVSRSQNGASPSSTSESDEIDDLDDEAKVARLVEMFPTIPCHRVSFVLKKCNGRWQRAMEELLNHVWFEDAAASSEDGHVVQVKGIDGFAEEVLPTRNRKLKGKKQRQRENTIDESEVPAMADAAKLNPWKQTSDDIDFLCTRMNFARPAISSMYHKCGASTAATIAAFCNPQETPALSMPPMSPTIEANATELNSDFPTLTSDQCIALIRMTYASTSSAHELAKVLTARPVKVPTGSLQVIPRYTPFTEDPSPPSSPSRPTHSSSTLLPLDHANSLAASTSSARTTAFSNAQRAHRLGRSDPLMKAASSYYASLGHDLSAQHATASAAAADALVASQSPSPNHEIDVHGVNVKDAVRIAGDRTSSWWEGLGEEKAMRRVGEEVGGGGLKIVTGVGRHSEGGRAKLGPAVGKALVQDGWRVEIGSGFLVVKGKARR